MRLRARASQREVQTSVYFCSPPIVLFRAVRLCETDDGLTIPVCVYRAAVGNHRQECHAHAAGTMPVDS